MNKNIVIIVAIVVSAYVLLTQTDILNGSNSIGSINGQPVSNDTFDAYLKFKRIKIGNEKHREEIIKQYLEREALMRVIAEKEILDTALVEAEINDFKQQMYISRYFEKFLNDSVTDQTVQNYYVANATNYEHKQAHVAHILFRLNENMSNEERLAKQTAAQDVYSKLKANGDFSALANKNSEDKHSAKNGGDLGWLKYGAINQAFSEKTFSLEEGVYTEPFETPFGIHIVKLLEKPKTVKKPFEAVKGDIRYKLRQQAKVAEIKKLQSSVEVDIKG